MYGIGIRLYALVLWCAQWFVPKAKSWIEGRRDFFSHLPKMEKGRKVYWFHCASLGEFDQGLPLMNRLKEQDPSLFLYVTFFSPSGYEHYHKRKHKVDFVSYLPVDLKKNAKRLIRHFHPEKVFFIKYEFWKNYIKEAKKSGADVYSVSAIFRKNHRFFHPVYGKFFQGVLQQINFFFVQNSTSGDLLKSIGIDNVIVTGDTRFDRVIENRNQAEEDHCLSTFTRGKKVFIAGSTWPEDEKIIAEYINQEEERTPLIIAPHDISEAHLQQIESRFGMEKIFRYTHWNVGDVFPSACSILLVDCIGKLSNAYRYGRYAYVGGGFSGSLHNILEPAVFGLPVVFGPHHKRFPEAQQFMDAGVGFSVKDETQLRTAIDIILSDEAMLKQKVARLVEESAGATEKIIACLKEQPKIRN